MKRKAKTFILLTIIALAICLIFPVLRKKQPAVTENSSPKSYSRIISLAPSTTEILFALGLGDKVIGVSEFCNWPPEAKKIPKVGGLLNPNYEAVVAARPDLVITFDDMAEAENKFAALGIETLVVKHDRLDEILDSILTIGRHCDKAEKADQIVNEIRDKIRKIQSRIPDTNKPKVLISVGHEYSQNPKALPRNIYIAGDDGFYSEMIKFAGGQNAYGGKLPFPTIGAESVISMNPQIVIDIAPVTTKQTESRITIQQWKNFSQIDAAKNDRIYVFTEDYTAIPGPRFILTLEKIARIINPQLNRQEDEPNSN
ncbi:MAG: ABC transporter substrate-binding protein [Planctomycetes bacterium]|nr:ABC transporter substrate-binding protein [Planctomycetota bacterium]MBU1518935.1 ABC transporter substrate-binding protein [Planctomycetota bacterium]MBU2457952.1 ABC transporter substrate-binding protein [Planctomycetota bacterium]